MTIQPLPGFGVVPFGPNPQIHHSSPVTVASTTLDAVNDAVIAIGQIVISDEGGGTHTLDTSGSSKIEWRTGAVTFANAGTTVKVGIAAVDMANGPPARAVNVADVITFDVSKTMVGGGGGITANAAQSHVPDAGTKTMIHGDFVAICIQVTARAGADSIILSRATSVNIDHAPGETTIIDGVYTASSNPANFFITFADGATGFLLVSEIFSTRNSRAFSSADATKEYGQLYQLPYPVRVRGIYGWLDPDATTEVILYSDPLGTPVAERAVTIDHNTVASANTRMFYKMFSSPYDIPANTPIGAVFKPGASNITVNYKTLASAVHRISSVHGANGYGISRATGAFADANSGLDHYLIGLLLGGHDDGAGSAAAKARAGLHPIEAGLAA